MDTSTDSTLQESATMAELVPYDENLLEQARTQWQFGDWENLARLDRSTLQQHPDRAKIALLTAAARLQVGATAEATQLIRLARDWGCNHRMISQILIAGVYNSLGRAAAAGNQQQRALKHFGNALTVVMPVGAAKLLSQARSNYQLNQMGLIEQSNGHLRLSVQKTLAAPGSSPKRKSSPADRARYLNQNGEMLYKEGKYKLAVEYFERALELAPDNAWYCMNLAEAAARLDFKKNDEWECEELAGTIAETGKWDVVVRHYRRALKIDPAQVEAYRKTQVFSVEPAMEGQCDNPIFIVGCGHSGTSLMLAMLGNHPYINPIPKESAIFLKTDAQIQKIMRDWDAECLKLGKSRWAEKTPPHIFQINRFLAFRPQARFIIMLRDGRDVVCSLKKRIGYEAIQDRLDRWIYDNMAAESYWTHPQVIVVKYEELITETEATLRTICRFLGEDYRPEMMDYHKTEHRWYSDKIEKPDSIKNHADHNANRNWQINQPIFDGRGRWPKELTASEIEAFKASPAQALLERLGYAADAAW